MCVILVVVILRHDMTGDIDFQISNFERGPAWLGAFVLGLWGLVNKLGHEHEGKQ